MGKWFKGKADPGKLAPIIKELFPPVGEAAPFEVAVFVDPASDTIRRADAMYANGWTVRLNFNRKGDLTSRSATLKLSSEVARAS